MYISDDNTLYHAVEMQKNNANSSEASQTDSVYLIEPVKDKQLCALVFEYFKLVNEQPKGIFTINMSGGLVKTENSGQSVYMKMNTDNSQVVVSSSQVNILLNVYNKLA